MVAKKKKLLLMIDEIQHIATNSAFTPLAATLRTAIDKNTDTVHCIFTGSSRHGMSLLFNKSSAALHNFAKEGIFPDLGEDFLQFIGNKLRKEYRISITKQELQTAFVKLDKSPFWFMHAIHDLVLREENSISNSVDYTLSVIAKAEDYSGTLKRMKPLDEEVYLMLADGVQIYTEDTIKKLRKKFRKNISTSLIQKSIERLTKLHLISTTERGTYLIEKPGFTNYYLENYSE